MEMTPEQNWRLFFALWPDAGARTQAAAQAEAVNGRRVTPDNMHVTLLFVGDVPVSRVPELEAAAAEVRGQACGIRFDRREITRRGIAWLAAHHVPQELLALHEDLMGACAAHGFEPEVRPFRPHLTLARRARPHRPQPIEPFGWKVRSFALVRSLPGESGVVYETLREWPLGEAE